MKQIHNMVLVIAKIAFKKDVTLEELIEKVNSSTSDLLYNQLMEMISSFKINEAEDLLFSQINPSDVNYLLLAAAFYNRLNELSDEELEGANFSRDEIKSGLEDVAKIFGLYEINKDLTQGVEI